MFVEARVLGQQRSALEPYAIDLADLGSPTLRDVIDRLVRVQVAEYADRQRAGTLLRVLTPDDLARGAQSGSYRTETRAERPAPRADDAVATALQAYEDRLYYVFVDDRQVESLDTELSIGPGTRVMFLRLVALAGG